MKEVYQCELPHYCWSENSRLIRITFLGEAEIAIKLGIKSQFADVGLRIGDSILGVTSFFFF